MIELLLAATAAAAIPSAPPPRETVDRTYQTVKGAVVNANLLMASAQARLKRLQLAFNEAGAGELRDKAKSSFESFTGRLSSFRSAADALDAARPDVPAKAGGHAAAAAAAAKGGSTTELLDEIGELRAAYDAAAGRRAVEDLRKVLSRWGASLSLRPQQQSALSLGRSLAAQAREAARSLTVKKPLKIPRVAEAVGREIKGLAEDAAALEVELELLSGRYRLDNLLRSHPELGSPAAGGGGR